MPPAPLTPTRSPLLIVSAAARAFRRSPSPGAAAASTELGSAAKSWIRTPSAARAKPSAAANLAGPEAKSASRFAAGRRERASSTPRMISPARKSTADAVPAGEQMMFPLQYLPYTK